MSEHQRYSLRRFDAALTTGVVVSTSSACRSVPDARPPGQPVDLRGPGRIDAVDVHVPGRAEIVCTCPPDVSGGFVEEAVS